MPKDLDGPDRIPTEKQPPIDKKEDAFMWKSFSTPYEAKLQEDSEDIDIYMEQFPHKPNEPEMVGQPPSHAPEPEVQVSVPVEVAPAVRTSGRIKNRLI